ncbi:MAG: hypothetical protein M3299_15525 [Thermoproteota archaeon]|nr:hypothetical protein [Thermoproteota archaeon]
MLQNPPKCADKLRRLLNVREREKEEEAMHIEYRQRLVTEEIEMFNVLLYLMISE